MTKNKLLLLLALLLTAATGAWAQEEVLLTTVTATGMSTYSQSPDGVVTVVVSGNDTYDADWGWYRLDEGTATITVTAAEGYTITRCVFKQYPSDYPNRVLVDDKTPFVMTINGAGIGFGSCFVEASDGQRNGPSNMDGASVIEVYGAAPAGPTTYKVTMKDGVKDADKWTVKAGNGDYQALPLTGVAKGAALTLKYAGTKKVKSVKAVKKAEAPSLVIEDKNNFFGIGNQKFYFTEGETWTEAMANHPENAAAGWVIYNDRLRFKPDVYGYAIFILRSGDYYIIEDKILNEPIDTSKTYMFSGTTPT